MGAPRVTKGVTKRRDYHRGLYGEQEPTAPVTPEPFKGLKPSFHREPSTTEPLVGHPNRELSRRQPVSRRRSQVSVRRALTSVRGRTLVSLRSGPTDPVTERLAHYSCRW